MWLPKDEKNVSEADSVSAFVCMKNVPIFFTFSIIVTAATCSTFINPLYSKHIENLGMVNKYEGFVFSSGAFFYMIFLYLIPYISKIFDKKLTLCSGLIMGAIGCLIMAPETYLGFKLGNNMWYLVTIG